MPVIRIPVALAAGLVALAGLAQDTCYTSPQGATLCSSGETAIHGHSDSNGNHVFRDDRGQRLDFDTDARGNASLETRSGERIRWSQPVLGQRKYPALDTAPPAAPAPVQAPAPPINPLTPSGGIAPPPGIPSGSLLPGGR